ncbi:hypothetical protein ACQ7HM_11705 [Williamsia sp. MIQD14]|uniref:hypothetical protein n=1 Tax=Williamsia sp. MIQD14 TaxID=3425703 RepID=UPI003DA021A6
MTSIDQLSLVDHRRGDDHDDADAVDRLMSPLVGATLGATTVAATLTTAACVAVHGFGALIALLTSAAVLITAHLGLQLQAAVATLRDGRWGDCVVVACMLTTSVVALYLLAAGAAGGMLTLTTCAACVVMHVRHLARAPRSRTTSPPQAAADQGVRR